MLDQLCDRLRRDLLVDHEHVRQSRDQADRLEILLGVVLEVLVDEGIDGVRAHGADQQRVAILARACDRRCADIAARPGAVLDDERRSVFLLQTLGEDAPEHVGGAAGAERYDDGDLALRPVLCLRLGLGGGEGQHGKDRDRHYPHGQSSLIAAFSCKLTTIASEEQDFDQQDLDQLRRKAVPCR